MGVPFPRFCRINSQKNFSHWDQHDDGDGNQMECVPVMHENEGSFRTCGLMDESVFEATHLRSRTDREGPNNIRGPILYIKQRSAYARYKKTSWLDCNDCFASKQHEHSHWRSKCAQLG